MDFESHFIETKNRETHTKGKESKSNEGTGISDFNARKHEINLSFLE